MKKKDDSIGALDDFVRGNLSIPLSNPFSTGTHYLSPEQPFFNLIVLTDQRTVLPMDARVGVLIDLFKSIDVQQEFEKLKAIKKEYKFKANILYTVCANVDILGHVVASSVDSPKKFTCILGAVKLLKSLELFVSKNKKETGKDYSRVCSSLVEANLLIELYTEQYFFYEKNYSQVIKKANFVIDLYRKVKSERIMNPLIDLHVDLAISYLFQGELEKADVTFNNTLELFKSIRFRQEGMQRSVISMIKEFMDYYGGIDLIKLMEIIEISKKLNFDDNSFFSKLIKIESLILPKISIFLTERMLLSTYFISLTDSCVLDSEAGALLIKFKSPELSSHLLAQLDPTELRFKSLGDEDSGSRKFDISVIFQSEGQGQRFLECCRLAERASKKTKVTVLRSVCENPVLVSDEIVEKTPECVLYDYEKNLSDDFWGMPVRVPKNEKCTLKKSLEGFKKEIMARRNGLFKPVEVLAVVFNKSGLLYSQNSDCPVVSMGFQGKDDVYFGVLNPIILDRLPVNVRPQISNKFKLKSWEQAAYEDCRQEMKRSSAKTGRKELLDWIFKLRLLGHEFGDIRIYGKVIETVENPNKPGHFCHLVAFTGLADDGHKNHPECLEMPKIKKTSLSEEDDTYSAAETGESRSNSSSPSSEL